MCRFAAARSKWRVPARCCSAPARTPMARRGERLTGTFPSPSTLPSPENGDADGGWDLRLLTPGGFWTAERKRLWARDRWRLVAGEEPSPAVRAALAADLPNPLANSSAEGLQFINADLTLILGRLPVSEWIGLEVSGHLGHDGVAVGSCTLYDTSGAIGWSSVCAIANTATLTE